MCDRKASYGCCSRSNVSSSCSSTPKKETSAHVVAPKKEEYDHNAKASEVAPAPTAHVLSAPKTEVKEEAVSVVKQEEAVKVDVGK